MLRINISTATAEITETETITAGRVGMRCGFTFDSAWDGLAKTVVVSGVVRRDRVLVGDEIEVPGECLVKENFPLKIGVVGKNGDGTVVIPTVWANFGKISPSVETSGETPAEPTPDVVAQIQQNSANALLLAQRVMQMAENGEFDGEDGAAFTPSVSSEGVISWTNDKGLPNPAPVNIKGETGAPGVPGDDYVLTDEDRADIALDVAETVLERATVSGNPLVISNGVGGTRPLSLLCEVEAAEAVTLTRTGKNIWDSARFLEADGWTLEEDGSFSGYNSELYYSFGRSGKSLFGNTAWNEQVTVSFDLRKDEGSTVENAIEIVLNYADGTKTRRQNRGSSTWQHCSVSSTIGKTIASIQFTYGSKAKIWLKNFQVEFNGADTGYQPYAATVYQLPIPDAPASGTIDLTDAARDAVTMLAGANVVFADCTSLTMTYPVRPAGSGGNVQSVNGKTGEVVLSASDVHALPDTTEIPSRTSQLQNDSGYLTQHQSLAAYRTAAAQDVIDQQQNTAITAKYSKPSGGIPKTDLAAAVQTSLGKADTALQPGDVTEPLVATYTIDSLPNGSPVSATCDKTFSELATAMYAGTSIVCLIKYGASPLAITGNVTNDLGSSINASVVFNRDMFGSIVHNSDDTCTVDVGVFANGSIVPANDAPVSGDTVYNALLGKLDINQGSSNAGKVLKVGNDGTVAPGDYDNRFIVTLTPTALDYSGTMDKTPAELTAAYDAGKRIVAYIPAMGFYIEQSGVTVRSNGLYGFGFNGIGEFNGGMVILNIVTQSSSNTYIVNFFPLATGQWTGGSY